MDRPDTYDRLPAGMREYLAEYGWHFSKPMFTWATSLMQKGEGKPAHKPVSKEEVEAILEKYNVKPKNNKAYDAAYVYNMAMADFFGSSIPNEQYLALYVKDYLDDPDGYDGIALTRFAADCMGRGVPIIWEDYI